LTVVPEDKALNVNWRSICRRKGVKSAVVAGGRGAAIGGGLPIMIYLHMDSMHTATRGVVNNETRPRVRGVNIHSSIGLEPIGVSCSSVYSVENCGRVLLNYRVETDTINLDKC